MANPAAEVHAKVLAAHPEAVIVERGQNHIKHRLADAPHRRRRYALDCSIGPIHYGPDTDQEIDTAFEPSTAPWQWEMTHAGFEVRALSCLDAGQVIEYRDGGEWVRFQPHALQYSNALDQIQPISMPGSGDAEMEDDTLTWPDGYGPGISICWQVQTARLAKLLTIASADALPPAEQFIIDGVEACLELNFIFAFSSGITPYVNGQPWGRGANRGQRETQGLVEFRDDTGNILWWFNLPYSWDSSGDPELGQQLGTFRFKRVGNALYVSHRVPLAFVQGAVYPLVVDVNVDDQVDANSDDMYQREDTGQTVDGAMWQAGQDDDFTVASRWWPGWRWKTPTPAWPAMGDTIDVAYMEAYFPNAAFDDPHCHIYAEDAAGPPTFVAAADNFNISGRTPTTDKVNWSAIGVAAGGADFYQTPSLVAVIQELVTSYTITAVVLIWRSGLIDTTHVDRLYYTYSYNHAAAEGAKLHIEYTSAAAAVRRRQGQMF